MDARTRGKEAIALLSLVKDEVGRISEGLLRDTSPGDPQNMTKKQAGRDLEKLHTQIFHLLFQ